MENSLSPIIEATVELKPKLSIMTVYSEVFGTVFVT